MPRINRNRERQTAPHAGHPPTEPDQLSLHGIAADPGAASRRTPSRWTQRPALGHAEAVSSSVEASTRRPPLSIRFTPSTFSPSRSSRMLAAPSSGVMLSMPVTPRCRDCLDNNHDHQGVTGPSRHDTPEISLTGPGNPLTSLQIQNPIHATTPLAHRTQCVAAEETERDSIPANFVEPAMLGGLEGPLLSQ